ncbi:MAG: SCO1664 family protein [Terrimesophilobacter sp.]
MAAEVDLHSGELELTGRITSASNATFLGGIGGTAVIYKPVAGERPLWDFPDHDLARREIAAYLVSESLGWNVVPCTWLRDGPFGVGMVQLWQDADPKQDAVDLVLADAVPDGWRRVFAGTDEQGHPVALIHENSHALRRMAVFDIVVNNADRKGAHILPMAGGHRHGVDHGLTFHVEHKLRTVLWGWLGEPLNSAELAGIDHVRSDLVSGLGDALGRLVSDPEIEALDARCQRLLLESRFPAPHGDMPAMPWPLF